MKILRPWGVIAALLVTSPALYAAFVTATMPTDVALTRFLIAVPVCSIAISAVVSVMDAYAAGFGVKASQRDKRDGPERRSVDRG